MAEGNFYGSNIFITKEIILPKTNFNGEIPLTTSPNEMIEAGLIIIELPESTNTYYKLTCAQYPSAELLEVPMKEGLQLLLLLKNVSGKLIHLGGLVQNFAGDAQSVDDVVTLENGKYALVSIIYLIDKISKMSTIEPKFLTKVYCLHNNKKNETRYFCSDLKEGELSISLLGGSELTLNNGKYVSSKYTFIPESDGYYSFDYSPDNYVIFVKDGGLNKVEWVLAKAGESYTFDTMGPGGSSTIKKSTILTITKA